jgi:hypothetical protein
MGRIVFIGGLGLPSGWGYITRISEHIEEE